MANKASQTILQLWVDVTAANGVPTTAADGLDRPRHWDKMVLFVKNDGTGTTATATAKLWGYIGGDVDDWFPVGKDPGGAGAAASAGLVNDGFAIGAFDGANDILHSEIFSGLSGFDRLYLELTALTSTPTLQAWLRRWMDEGKR